MSVTVRSYGEVIAVCYTKEHMLLAIDRAFGLGDQASFEIFASGQESIIIREAMRRYCEEPKLAAEMNLAAITPEGYEYASHEYGGGIDTGQIRHVHVRFRKLAPPVRYEYVTDQEYRFAKVGDFLLQGDGDWVEVDESLARVCADAPRLCYRRVEVKP